MGSKKGRCFDTSTSFPTSSSSRSVQRLLFSSSCYSSTTKAERAEKAEKVEKKKCKSTEINSSCFNAVERSPINFRIGIREFGLLVLDWGFSNADLKVLDWGLRILESLSMSTFF